MSGHDDQACGRVLVDGMADLGIGITASTAHPLIRTAYTVAPFTCPHGVRYWIEPTGEQVAEWRRDGVA
jgi:hypothetical protein